MTFLVRSVPKVLLAASVLFAVACTKSHDVTSAALLAADGGVPDDAAGSGAGTGSAAGSGGGAGTGIGVGTAGGGAGMGGSAGTGSTSMCTDCQPASVIGMELPACCAEGDVCGLDVSQLGMGDMCLERDAPGNLDPNCPTVTLMGFLSVDGCCRPDGTCGIMDTFVGLGCTFNPEDQGIPCNPGPE